MALDMTKEADGYGVNYKAFESVVASLCRGAPEWLKFTATERRGYNS